MSQRLVPAVLIALLVIFHAQLWLGRGSIVQNTAMQNRIAELKIKNERAKTTNAQLAAEVRDLKEGLEMVEEKARYELGMVKPNEILVQLTK
jgi:cell division protein FtsB